MSTLQVVRTEKRFHQDPLLSEKYLENKLRKQMRETNGLSCEGASFGNAK